MKTTLILTAALALSAGFAQAETVRIGTEGAYPPYNLVDDNGDLAGFEIDLGNELCTRAELDCAWVKTDWDSIIPNLTSGNYDAIMAGMSITPERREIVGFTQNYLPPSPTAYAALSDDVDLTGGVVAAQTGTIQAAYVAESGASLLEFGTADEAVAAVRNGEADAALIDKDLLIPVVEESNGELVFVGDDVMLGEGIGMAVRQSDAELAAKFDTAITAMKEDGSLNKLIIEWFTDQAVLYED